MDVFRKVMALALILTLITAARAWEIAEAPACAEARIVTKVLDEGQVVAGVRLLWDTPFAAGKLTIADFAVNGYTIVALYVNEDGAWRHAQGAGRYVFLEFEDPVGVGVGTHNTLQLQDGKSVLRDLTIDVQCLWNMNFYAASGYIHTEIDDYFALSETAGGYTTPYRLFIPEGWEEEKLPLVIWLHGAGERGNDNFVQLATGRGALNFSDAEAQAAHPCFVVAPQAGEAGWDEFTLINIRAVARGLVENFNADPARIYVAGYSGGTVALALAYPDTVAAALIVTNSGFPGGEADLRTLSRVPMWLVAAEEDGGAALAADVDVMEGLGIDVVAFLGKDGLNGFLRGQEARADALRVIGAAETAGARLIATTYVAGTVLPDPRRPWMAATDNAAVRDWLFSQTSDAN